MGLCKPIFTSNRPKLNLLTEEDTPFNLPLKYLSTTQASISEGQYCSQSCLLGLATDNPTNIDKNCPNAAKHGRQHLSRTDLISLIRAQIDAGSSSSCLMPLNMSGSRGSLYRVTLLSHGYILLAKGVQQDDEAHLLNEVNIYRRLAPIQGRHIPVYIGETSLSYPLILPGGQAQPVRIITRLILISYAGINMSECLKVTNEAEFTQGIEECIKAIHALGVLHTDASSNNILWLKGSVRVIDFERSKTRETVEEEEEKQEEEKKKEEEEWEREREGERTNTGERSDESSSVEERRRTLWAEKCEQELWDSLYSASSWLSVVGKLY